MLTTSKAAERAATTFRKASDCRIEDLAELTSRQTVITDYPFAADVQSNVLIYDCNALRDQIADPHTRQQIMAEWADAMMNGPGVLVLKRAETDLAMIDRASEMFRGLIAEQNRLGTGGGDHFAKPGANDRLWNSLEKHCLADPENFLQYYGNPFLAAVSEAWLGPNYQMTAQLNVVNPGGASQSPHRDYHLGFQTAADIERFPLHVHLMSPCLTLQGAIAHVDAPIETGPTLLLPYSQLYPSGYLAMGLPVFRAHFEAHHVQLPLEKGDMLFFSPALLHAAGSNKSADVRRMVNLFQVSSAYGRAMESVNRTRMIKALYPVMLRARADGTLTGAELAAAIAASAEGYAFPTNLDNDPPIGGIAPRSQAALVTEALAAGWPAGDLFQALDAQEAKRLA
jgi:ectoine hydroxylase-related dioxygenase (phytanoyl-CoA dioxygenase family)